MRILRLLMFVFLATAAVCRGQNLYVTNSGWLTMDAVSGLEVTNDESGTDTNADMEIQANGIATPAPASYGEIVTPELQALADGMQGNPLTIFNFVHDHIRYVPYFGCIKGAQLTYLEKSGNDFDQCALLVALLRAAGCTNASYQFGWMMLPYDNPDGSSRDIHHWYGLAFSNTSWTTTSQFLNGNLTTDLGYPTNETSYTAVGNNLFALQRVWVTVTIGGTNFYLDPSFKVSQPITGINLTNAMGLSSNSLMTAAGGTDVGNLSGNFYVTNLNEANLRATLAGYSGNLLNYIQTNCPNVSAEQVLGGQYIVPSTNTALSQSLLFPTTNWGGQMPIINWTNVPTNVMATFMLSFGGTNYHCFMPQLQGECLSMVVGSGGGVTVRLDQTNVATGSSGGGSGAFVVTLSVFYPGFGSYWNTNNNTFTQGKLHYTAQNYYQKANASYAIMYGFSPDWGWLQERQQRLQSYRQQGLADTSWQVVTESLNVMGLNYLTQTEYMSRILAQEMGLMSIPYHHIGRMAQESGSGYFVDAYMILGGTFATTPVSNAGTVQTEFLGQSAFFLSAMEHGLIEQLQSTNLIGASSIKILELATTNNQAVYLANSGNWASVSSQLTHYNSTALNAVEAYINQGCTVLLPHNGTNAIAGPGSWTGFGFLAFVSGSFYTIIGDANGVFGGGYVSDLGATVDPGYINMSGYTQPDFFDAAPASLPSLTGADPVDMADGTFQVQTTDLSLGATEPRGLNFSRYYNSTRRNSSLAGISPGWVHNYYLNAATISAPQAALGGATPAQMAPLLVATAAASQIFQFSNPDPNNWTTAALIAKWGIDQITGKAVSVTLGKDVVQFIEQPDGSYTPPANNTMTMSQSSGAYALQERHGRTFQFNGAGWCTNIVDPYSQSLQLTYNSSNWVTEVTDSTGRTLTFQYNSAYLTNVTDSASRSVKLGYSGGGDLNAVTDPEGKTSTFLYDTNHQIIVTSNALGQVVASNIYNGFGRVTKQYTEGITGKEWQIFWSGWQTIEQNPQGGQRTFFYDDKSRQIGLQDAMGNLSGEVYDGQDHLVLTVSPLGETNQFIYDGNNNLVESIDPLGFSNQFVYDAQNRLTTTIDALGHSNSFGYNSQFSVTSYTNGNGDWRALSYNGDGTLATNKDSGGSTSYSYDSHGTLSGITYPGSLGSEGFVNNALGDATSHTDARGFATTFAFNQRRQLTNAAAPTNVAVSLGYDAVGNLIISKDARGNSVSNFWSATQQRTGVVYPVTPQGSPTTTNSYDTRDWLASTVNPLGRTTYFTNDAAHRLIEELDPLDRPTTLAYDNDNHETNATDAASETTKAVFDVRGNVVKIIDAAAHTVAKTYDGVGNLIDLTNRNGQVWQFKYDGDNRLTNTTSPTGKVTSQIYNNRGLLQSITDPLSQTTSFGYDARGRMTSMTNNLGTTTYQRDLNGNVTNASANGQSLQKTFDAYNRLTSATDVNGYTIQYRHNANGNLTNLIYPGGLTVNYFYDSNNRLTNVTDWSSRQTSYSYDLAGDVTSVTRPNGTLRLLSYDNDGELTNIIEKTTTQYPIAFFTLSYNLAGRVQWEFKGPLPHTNTPLTRTMAYDADNRLTTFNGTNVTLDADGNMTSGPGTNGTFLSYSYDPLNRLTSAGGISYGYDPANNRVAATNGGNAVFYVIDPATSQVLMRVRSSSTNYYIYGNGLVYEIDVSGSTTTTAFYHFDCRGSTVTLTDSNGNPKDIIEYSAYGSTTYRYGTNDTPFLYNGQYGVQTDTNGLLYMRARYYNPYICRFLNPDPSGFQGGLNLYQFANGNPISMTDPFGLGAIGENGAAAAMWENVNQDLNDLLGGGAVPQAVQEVIQGAVNFATLGVAGGIEQGEDAGDIVQDALEYGEIDANVFLALATEGFSAEAEIEAEVGAEAAQTTGALTTPGNVPLGFSPVSLEEGSFVNRVYDSSGAANTSGMWGQSFSPGSGLPTDAASAITSRGLNPAINNAQVGAVFQVNQSITVYQGTSLGGTAPELFIPSALHPYLTPVRGLTAVPIVPGAP